MNRHAYLAELSQLLYYMTPWDREALIAEYRQKFEDAEDDAAVIQELGSPMKTAVRLSRSYTPSPAPDPEPVPTLAPDESVQTDSCTEPAETASSLELTQTDAAVPESAQTDSPETPEATCPEPDAQQSHSEDVADSVSPEESAPAQADAHETDPQEPVSESSGAEETAAEKTSEPAPVEEIFSEIYQAATMAQSAVLPSDVDAPTLKTKARGLFLVPYAILCVALGIPVTALLFVIDVLIFAAALAALGCGVYILLFLGKAMFHGLGNKLVIIGLSILAFTAAVALGGLGVWFLRNAAIGWVRFLYQFGLTHGYCQEEVQ